jgi:hypothetical protein
MIAYNVGDSFTFPGSWAPDETKHFWHQIARNCGCTKFVNDSEPGRSNDRIIKLVMQHALENPTADVLYLINITTIYRFDITDTGGDKFHDVLKPKTIAELDFELVECTLYMQLIGLIELLNKYPRIEIYEPSHSELLAKSPFYKQTLIYHDEHHLNEIGAAFYGHLLTDWMKISFTNNEKYEKNEDGLKGMFEYKAKNKINNIDSYPNEIFYWNNKHKLD